MRFLADESVDVLVITALRQAEHDVKAVAEDSPGADDTEVAQHASLENRVLLTEDRDFGRLVYAELQESSGVVYLRYPSRTRHTFSSYVAEVVRNREERLLGAFTVIQPGRTRISRLPPSDRKA